MILRKRQRQRSLQHNGGPVVRPDPYWRYLDAQLEQRYLSTQRCSNNRSTLRKRTVTVSELPPR